LRLVWDKNSSTISTEVEAIWKGYRLPCDSDAGIHDKHGRYVKEYEREIRLINAEKFDLVLDEFPYGVDIIDFHADAQSSSTERDMHIFNSRLGQLSSGLKRTSSSRLEDTKISPAGIVFWTTRTIGAVQSF
jgi:hypothetical protein